MSRLNLALFGPFQATLDSTPLLDFESNKVRALLAFLGTEGVRPHHRIEVATLLWPQMDDAAALRNLRHAIADLRRRLGDTRSSLPFLLVTRYTVQINPDADVSIDVVAFRHLLATGKSSAVDADAITAWEAALTLYRGEFLQGFHVRNSVPWEEWVLLRREEFEHGMIQALRGLALAYERGGNYKRAGEYVRQWIQHTPWNEEAHHELIRLLALDGQRSAALAQYESCRTWLENALGVEPTPETTALANAIRDGNFPPPTALTAAPRIHSRPAHPPSGPRYFVAREQEMARLQGFLNASLAGKPQIAFITGEAGSGKSALATAFGQQVLMHHNEVVVVRGESNAFAGQGDPFLPFRDILLALVGDHEAMHLGSEMGDRYVQRIQRIIPITIPLLVQVGPDLVDALALASPLIMQAEAFLPQSAHKQALLQELRRHKDYFPDTPLTLSQSQSFTQFGRMLSRLSAHAPLLLIVDDLQWADAGSLSLFFHLSRRLHDCRVFLLGIFRSEEILIPGNERGEEQGRRHPLALIVHELQRQHGDILVDLDRRGGRDFVDAYLDMEPNCLGEDFRRQVWRHTGGNALFTVELLRALQERGDIFRDARGDWQSRDELGWAQLPPRVEAIIAERTERLPPPWKRLLLAASVIGENFTAELLAGVLEWPLPEVRQSLEALAAPPRRLVQFRGHSWVAQKMLSMYRFRHILFQNYLYGQVPLGERTRWHQKIALILESQHGSQREGAALQIARHFEAGHLFLKAAEYYQLAGLRAMQLFAPAEALALYGRGLALLQEVAESPQRSEQEMALQMAMSAPLLAMQGWGAPERAQASQRAYDLCRQTGNEQVLVQALFVQADMLRARAEHGLSLQLGEQLLHLAAQEGTASSLALAHWTLGETHFFLGELDAAHHHLTRALEYYDPDASALTPLTAVDLGVVCHVWLSWVEERLDHPEIGLKHVQAALDLARSMEHPLSLIFALTLGAYGFYWLRNQPELAAAYEAELMPLMAQETLASVHPWGHVFLGWVQATLGDLEGGIAEMRTGLDAWEAMGAVSGRTCQVIPLIEAYIRAERMEEAQSLVDESLQLVEQTGERMFLERLLDLKQQAFA